MVDLSSQILVRNGAIPSWNIESAGRRQSGEISIDSVSMTKGSMGSKITTGPSDSASSNLIVNVLAERVPAAIISSKRPRGLIKPLDRLNFLRDAQLSREDLMKAKLRIEKLEVRHLLAALYPAYVNGQFTLGDPQGSSPYGLANTFALSSRPSASKTIYLDFDGHHSVNNSWGHNILFPAFDRNGNPNSFSNSELLEIQQVFQNVAEDFAPFDVNVTTEDPGSAAIIRTGSNDQYYGIRALQTQSTAGFGDGIGGVAFVGSFGDGLDNPVFTFNKGANNGAMTVSHEVGHAMGLGHDGLGNATYHPGSGSGATAWGPIMGAPFHQNITQWSIGDYAGATNLQDDLRIITSQNGFGYRADDHGSSLTTATRLDANSSDVVWGIIERNSDVDVFEFTTTGGNVTIDVDVMGERPNLDVELRVINTRGNPVLSVNPQTTLTASVSQFFPAGTYFLSVLGGGRDGFYSDYGSLGFYTVNATFPQPNDGDFNDDGVLDAVDIDLLTEDIVISTRLPGNPDIFDMTGDGRVTTDDLDEWLQVAGAANLAGGNAYLYGDANLDGSVDVSDFNSWNDNKFQITSRWTHGDFNASGQIDVADFNIWNANKFQSAAARHAVDIPKGITHDWATSDPAVFRLPEGESLPMDDAVARAIAVREYIQIDRPLPSNWSDEFFADESKRNNRRDNCTDLLQRVFAVDGE